jgi:predicted nucleic acid-binding protein
VWIRARYQPLALDPKPIISIVTAGELRSLTLQYRWGKAKIDQMEFILGYFDEIPIDSPALVDAYAVIDAHLQLQGHILGKNDLWIATTAHVLGATLLATDRDFDSLVPAFLARDWIDPNTTGGSP